MSGRAINQAGRELIEHFEGLRLSAYPDPATGGEPYTIGYGHTGGVKPGDTVTQSQAETILDNDLRQFEREVTLAVEVDINDNQFAALVSFAFNLGVGALVNSTLMTLLNRGDYNGAADQFLRWTHAGGVEMPGLVTRRHAERDLFLKPVGK
ncbi:Phage lysozyme [Carnimonas sp. R-84981]|uniref:lysozyme n=1 Tax=Carnimonas bestiolae TaxID=3402172 RepID=UPI003EDB7132